MIGSTIARMNVLIGATDNATPTLNAIINKVGKLAIAAGALTGTVMIGKKSIDAAAEFNKVLTDSLVMFDNVSDAMRNKMAKAARELSTQIPRSANDIAGAYYYLGSAGLDAATALESLKNGLEKELISKITQVPSETIEMLSKLFEKYGDKTEEHFDEI